MKKPPPHCLRCEYVRQVDGCFEIFMPWHHAWQPFEPGYLKADRAMVPIVAALEAVAWLEEVDHLDQLLGEMCERNIQRYNVRGKTVGIENTQELRDAINVAEDNALAWRAWEANDE